ncbi:hypothetical protein [Pedobacter aquatilis]|uniref:hypothetical protein n=1 Tax=Pedobacter aquatilis TaxID=351343 RepID=UPI002931ABD3|nr:hypothetical protein [Pedobacter aquatilis]
MIDTTENKQLLFDYYRDQFIDSHRSKVEGDNTMIFLVREDTDLLLYAKAAKQTWESAGDYPDSFTGIVKTENENGFASFTYIGAIAAVQEAL